MHVEVKEHHREYDGVFQLDRAVVRYEKFDGHLSDEVTRLVFERGDSVAVLLYDPDRDSVILVKQFRYPVYVRDKDNGWLLEIVAGIVDRNRMPEEVARAELMEEAGYSVGDLEHIGTFYPSPGACSERIHLYLVHVSAANRMGPGGGRLGESEDIEVHEISLDEALRLVRQGTIRDATTIIGLQHLALRSKVPEVEHA